MNEKDFDYLNSYYPFYNVSRETFSKFVDFFDLLKKWNLKYSLVQENTLENFFERHLLDSLQLIKYINFDDKILDLGSGGGLPAIILSIMGYNVDMIDFHTKKCFFLEEVSRQLNLTNNVFCKKIEDHNGTYNIIVSRACSNLNNLLKYMNNVSRETNKKGIFLKGENYQIEIDEAKKKWEFMCQTVPSITSKKSSIIIIENLNKR